MKQESDSNFTFRVNSELKKDFIELCERESYSAASALKRYMMRCVQLGYITHDFRTLNRNISK